MASALECGLMTESEVTALLYLIRSPDVRRSFSYATPSDCDPLGSFPQSSILTFPLVNRSIEEIPWRF